MEGRPYIELDGIPYPLTQNSLVTRSPLQPFSPAIQAGNSTRITDARLAVRVWDDFTGGLGQRDDDGVSTSYAEGDLDARVPGAVALPPRQKLLKSIAGWDYSNNAPVFIEYMQHASSPGLFLWSRDGGRSSVYRFVPNTHTFTFVSEEVLGFASFKRAHFNIAFGAGNTKVYRTVDAGANWTSPVTHAGKKYRGLVVWDNKLFSYNETDETIMQSLDGTTWTTFGAGPELRATEEIREIVVWGAPGGQRDTLYLITTLRVLGYQEDAQEWHPFYDYEGIFKAKVPSSHMWRRDSNLYFAPCDEVYDSTNGPTADKHSLVLMFTPGTSDEIGPNKRFAFPDGMVNGLFRLQGGVHWLYGFAFGSALPGYGTPNLTGVIGGGFFAFNEMQGWTCLHQNSGLMGGGYANGKAWTLDSGGLYEFDVPDRRQLPPLASGVDYAAPVAFRPHYLRSHWTDNQAKNRWKLANYWEIDMRLADGTSGVPVGSTVILRWRTDNQPWQQVALGSNPENDYLGMLLLQMPGPDTTEWPVRVPMPPGGQQIGVAYKRIQWEIWMERGGVANQTPVLASVALYYTFWQENHYSYTMQLDLTPETWGERADSTFNGYTRAELQHKLLTLNDKKQYVSFLYAPGGGVEELVPAVDVLIAAREDADWGGGVYNVTVRDVSVD